MLNLGRNTHIATVQHQIVQRGEFRGGTVPYGYKLIESGEISKQGRVRHILAIHEPEAAVIRMIFRMIVEDGFSMYELTRYLSTMELPPDTRKLVWRSSSLHVMLRNRIYIGQQRITLLRVMTFKGLPEGGKRHAPFVVRLGDRPAGGDAGSAQDKKLIFIE